MVQNIVKKPTNDDNNDDSLTIDYGHKLATINLKKKLEHQIFNDNNKNDAANDCDIDIDIISSAKTDRNHIIRKIKQTFSLKDMEDYSPPSDESDNNSEIDLNYQEKSINGYPICRGCTKEIIDKYYLRVNQTSWHEDCLKCNYCNTQLECDQTCFIKKKQILCKLDYYKHFGIKCAKCSRNIQSSDWVRRAKDNVYHLACFACENCKRQLSTGEEFALHNNKLLCKTHYCECIDGDNGDTSKHKNKRVRTTFTEEQLQILQANFDVDSNPDGQDLERIAQITGLSKRVTQVWFQNSRARQKKYKEKKYVNSDTNENMSNDDTWMSHGNNNTNNNNTSNNGLHNNNVNTDTHTSDGILTSSTNKKRLHNLTSNNEMNLSWSSDSASDAHMLLYDNESSMDLNQD